MQIALELETIFFACQSPILTIRVNKSNCRHKRCNALSVITGTVRPSRDCTDNIQVRQRGQVCQGHFFRLQPVNQLRKGVSSSESYHLFARVYTDVGEIAELDVSTIRVCNIIKAVRRADNLHSTSGILDCRLQLFNRLRFEHRLCRELNIV